MVLSTEEKVAKKAKGMEKLKYKSGIALVLLNIDEEASEYSTEAQYEVRLYFKSKAAINRVAKLLGKIRFDKKGVTSNFEKGNKTIELYLSVFERYAIEAGENIIRKFKYSYHNHYSGENFDITILPTKQLSEDERELEVGSVADGGSMFTFHKNIQEGILSGRIQYIV